MKLQVVSAVPMTPDVLRVVFRHPLRPELPEWSPGAHVDLRLPDGKVRQYSLCGDPDDRAHYTVAIKREVDGRGGSLWAHANLTEGGLAHVSAPRNNFPLADGTRHVFVAGGIGITPFVAMARALAAKGGDFILHFCARSAAEAPLLDALRTLCGDRLQLWFSGAGRRFEPALIGPPTPGTHLYACGPQRLVDAVQAAADAGGWAPDRVHIERFAATLDVLRENGFRVASSCEIGTCGSCECGYRDGTVIHRDHILPLSQRQDRTFGQFVGLKSL